MSSNTKKRLFIALAGLLASSTAAVLVAYPGTSESRSPTSSAQAGNTDGIESDSLTGDGAAPFVIDFGVDTPFETYSPLADVVDATQGMAGRSSFDDEFGSTESGLSLEGRQLIAALDEQFGGGYDIGQPRGQVQLDASGPVSGLSGFDSLVSLGSSARIPGYVALAANPQGRPDSVPGGNSPGGSTPDSGAPDNSSPGSGSPDNSAPDNSAPGNSSPGGSSPGNSAPDTSAPGNGSPGNGAPGNGSPGSGSPIGDSDPVSVPEPGTMGLLAFGLAVAAAVRRRRPA